MLIFSESNNGFKSLLNSRFIYQETGPKPAEELAKAAEAAEAEKEKTPLPEKVVIEMAQLKARKNTYENWSDVTMQIFERQKDNLVKYLNLNNPDEITDPTVAYKHLVNLQKKMESEWKKEQLQKAKDATGDVDLGTYVYEFNVNPAPCKPLSKKEQDYLTENGKKMPDNQKNAYMLLVSDLQMKLTLEGEQAFREAAKKAGIDMSKVASAQTLSATEMAGKQIAQRVKNK